MIEDVVIRRFAAEDAGAVAKLIRRTLLESNGSDYAREVFDGLADWYGVRGLLSRMPLSTRFVAEIDEFVVGTAARRGDIIEGFFVDPGAQGRGVGVRLLEALVLDAREAARAVLTVESSLTAVGFYERQGFVPTGPPHDLGDGPVVPLHKTLSIDLA